MRTTIILFLFLLSLTCNSQSLPVNFDDCETKMFFTSVDEKPTFNKDSLDAFGYFNQYFKKEKQLEDFSGMVMVGIIIFEDGKPCCKTFINMTSEDIKPELFQKAVNDMPYWNPAKQKSKAVTFLMQLPLNFKNGQIISP
jgi:hypothetical protein